MFKIITDNAADMPKEYAFEHGIDTIRTLNSIAKQAGIRFP